MKHIADKVCSCDYCTMIDVMFGDPLLNAWERHFIASVASYGWRDDYSLKQKAVIQRLFHTQRRKYAVAN